MESTTDPVEVVTRFVRGLVDGDITTCLALVDDDLVFSEAPSLSFGGDRRGPQGVLDLLKSVTRDYQIKLGEPIISAAGDRVLVQVSGTIGSRATGREMALDALDLYEVRDGLITRVDVYYKDAAAVTALAEADPKETEREGGES